MNRLPYLASLWCLTLALSAWPTRAEDLGIRAPEGFEVSLYAPDELAHDIFSMTVDAQGRVVVAGAGYVKTLHDDNGDGRADRATTFAPMPASGAHGMYFDGADLICTGDNAVMRLRDSDGDGAADGKPEVWAPLRHPEHGANGIVRGPDGCYYVICGNDAGVSESLAVRGVSPVKHPRSGAVARFSAAGKPMDVVAHGFRNPYDLDFDAAGRLLTVDSDGERDYHLPWYAPTRLFDVAQGQEHGWLLMGWARGWNRPASFFDNVERLAEIGRGSPTGVVTYRHRQFPERYRGGVFAACWTLGRVYYFPLTPSGASYATQLEVFLQTTGDVGFAPCDLAVGPAGELYVAIGGRRTRGSVFRITGPQAAQPAEPRDDLDRVLTADQPLASWSRARWTPLAERLGRGPFEQAARDERRSTAERCRALEVLVETYGGVDGASAVGIVDARDPAVRARAAWALTAGRSTAEGARLLATLTGDEDLAVQRAAWEGLCLADLPAGNLPVEPDWTRGLSSPVRRVRTAAIDLAAGRGNASYQAWRSRVRVSEDAWRLRLAPTWIGLAEAQRAGVPATAADTALYLAALRAGQSDQVLRLEALRLIQLALGDVRTAPGQAEVYCGYVANQAQGLSADIRQEIADQLSAAFPTSDAEVNRELARTLGMVGGGGTGLLTAIARQWTATSAVEDDVHYLIVMSLLGGERSAEVTAATAECLLTLHAKLDALDQFPSRNWPQRLGEAFDELCRRDSELGAAVAASPKLSRVGQELLVARLPREQQPAAVEKLWKAVVASGQQPSGELVGLVARLPADVALPLVRAQWDAVDLRDAIVLALARHPRAEDRPRLVAGLASTQPGVVERAAKALVHLGLNCTSDEMVVALRALKQSCAQPKQVEPRRSLVKLLNFWTEENSDVDLDPDPSKVYIPWFEVFDQYYPAHAAQLRASSGADAAGWKRRLAAVPWDAGDQQRGRVVFEARGCHRCHQVSGHLGPELKGAVTRMSREDLFTAIIDPNLEVSPTYHTTLLATRDGQVYHGLVVYESPESTLLQTGPDTTVRVLNAETSSMRKSAQSLMPTGLLDPLTDQQLSDLYAYLRSLSR